MAEDHKSMIRMNTEADNRHYALSMLQEHQQAWEMFAAGAIRLIPVLKAHMASVTEETERSAMELLVHLRLLAQTSASASAEDRETSLVKVVMAMQFQDITRQKLEHVGQALDQWSTHLRALLKGPGDASAMQQISTLERIEAMYTMEEERRLHAEAVSPDYQEPVPTELLEPLPVQNPVTLF